MLNSSVYPLLILRKNGNIITIITFDPSYLIVLESG